jgi:hypothetical protein
MDHRRPARTAIAVAAGFTGVLLVVAPAFAVECPAPHPLTRPGVIKETPAQVHALSTLLASGDAENRIDVTVSDLRARYPGVENAEIVNYLVSAYCPVVERMTGLGEQERQARVDRFVSEVSRAVY